MHMVGFGVYSAFFSKAVECYAVPKGTVI